MMTKITGEAPFQVLTNNFSISPSQEGYTLQISADGRQYSNLFTVGAGVTRLVTGVAAGSYYRLSGNESEVSINWLKTCVTEGGGSGGAGNELTPVTEFPLGAEEGTVVAYASGDTVGIYQYIDDVWVEAGADVDLSAYWTSAETQSAITAVENHLFDVEEVTASALTELHDGLLEVSASTAGKADAANVQASSDWRQVFYNDQGIITGGTQLWAGYEYVNGRDIPYIAPWGPRRMGIYAPESAGTAGDILVSAGLYQAPVWSAVTMPDMSEYTPTSGFSTINGSAITNGGNLVIEGGSAADPTTLKSVSEFNPDAENGDVQSKYVEIPGLPDGVTFVTGNTYGDYEDQFGGTLTIPSGFAAGVTEDDPVYLMTVISTATSMSYPVVAYENEWRPGGVYLRICYEDMTSVVDIAMSPVDGEYERDGFGIDWQEIYADYVQDESEQGNMVVNFYAGFDYNAGEPYPDPVFDAQEASTEYGLYVKTGDGWEEISAPADVVTSSYITNIWKGTQAQYDAIVTKDPETFYLIVNSE